MSQNYKFKSLQISKEDNKLEENQDRLTVFEVGETKTIDFIQLDGTRQNFSYAHYITSWLGKEGNERVIKIFFATHFITVEGYCLESLYENLLKLSVKFIKAHDERYAGAVEEDKTFISSIEIAWKKENVGFKQDEY